MARVDSMSKGIRNPHLRGQGSLVRSQFLTKADLPNVKLKPKPGTVASVIAELEKIPDKSMPLYFDCPECGKGHIFKTVAYSAVVETERKT